MATHDSVPRVGLVVQVVPGNFAVSVRLMNSGVNRAAMMVAPSHGSTSSFLAAL